MAGSISYWNHNTAYHPWILKHVEPRGGRALDVGSGDGLLLERLRSCCDEAVGVECDERVAEKSRRRLERYCDITVVSAVFPDVAFERASFDSIVFVASLHHMDTRAALRSARELLRPGGVLLVVGLTSNVTLSDWLVAGLCLVPSRISSAWHREVRDPGCAIAEPTEPLRAIRRVCDEELAGYHLRRALHYRYLLRWVCPDDSGGQV